MKASCCSKETLLALLTAIGSSTFLTGCQTSIGGQTLPSATYLDDDVQYFPAGEEFLLPNQVRALEEYKASQASFENDLDVIQ
ncbi:MAG: hypothetical protein KDA89_02600 [Planctomycetaceae bacterium]|nr:hypothetical protein [Planctomycetaceae bacterium]